MNSRERVRTALTGGLPDRVPFALGFFGQTLDVIGGADADEAFQTDLRYAAFNPPREDDEFLRYLRRLPPDVHVGNLAQLRTYHEWNYHPELGPQRPLSGARSLDDLLNLALPNLTDPQRHAGLAGQVQRWHAQGLAVAGSPPHLGGELFETAWRLRGFDEWLIDLKTRPVMANYLLDQLTAMTMQSALILAQAGVDILLLDDDVALPNRMMISPAMWRAYLKPRLRDIIGAAREVSRDLLVFYHSDGNFTAIVPELVEIGVNVINPVQPDCMDAAAIRAEFGSRLALWGTVGTARGWDHGTPDDIRREVRLRAETLGLAGLLLAPAYDVDFTPLDNLRAFAGAVGELTYD